MGPQGSQPKFQQNRSKNEATRTKFAYRAYVLNRLSIGLSLLSLVKANAKKQYLSCIEKKHKSRMNPSEAK